MVGRKSVAVIFILALLVAGIPVAMAAANAAVSPSDPGISGPVQDRALVAAVEGTRGPNDIQNQNTGVYYADIATAVASATAGDTLIVWATFHNEGHVVIDRDITLMGGIGGERILANADTGDGASGDLKGWIVVAAGVTVTVENLSFDGNNFDIYQAFRVHGDGSFTGCDFNGIAYPGYQGTAIVAMGDNVDVSNCMFSDIGRVGVLYYGTGITASTASGNIVFGNGLGDYLQNGFELGAGAVATISGNQVSNCLGDAGATFGSVAILATGNGTVLTATSNNLLSNFYGIHVGASASEDTAATVAFNRIFGNDYGLKSLPSESVAAENNWWGCNEGPADVACGSALGTTGTVDYDPWLVLSGTAPDVGVSESGEFTGQLTINSDSVDVSGSGAVMDGLIINFFTDGSVGTVSPGGDSTVNGVASTTFTAGATPGVAAVHVLFDNADVTVNVAVPALIFADGFDLGNTDAWSVTSGGV